MNFMKFPCLFVLFVFLFFPCFNVFAVSSNEAVSFVVNSNHFLYEGETYTPPNVPVKFEEKDYWVIPLVSGNDIVTYFPVEVDSGKLSSSRSVNRGLFETAEKLREIQLLKNSISKNAAVEWVFTKKYETIFSETSFQLNDEIFQLNTVESTLKGKGFSGDFAVLKAQLKELSESSGNISQEINSASVFENGFVSKPSPETFSLMNGSFDSVFNGISALNDSSLLYQSNIDKIKQKISVADLDNETKAQIFSVLEVPQSLRALRNYNLDSTQIQESIGSMLSSISLRQDSLLSELDVRILKNEVYNLLYSENENIVKETDFLTLFSAQQAILLKENRDLWKNQVKVRELEQNYARALAYYNEKNFQQAKNYAEKSVENVVAIVKQGQATATVQNEFFTQDLLFKLAGLLVAILVVLYLFNNREKISGIISKNNGDNGNF